MKKLIIIPLLSCFFQVNSQINKLSYDQNKQIESTRQSNTLNKGSIEDTLKPIFYSIIGANDNSLNSEIATSFDKDKSTVKIDYTFNPFPENTNPLITNTKILFKGKLEVGESTNVFDLGNSDMPLVKSGLEGNILWSRVDYIATADGKKVNTFSRLSYLTMGLDYTNAKYKIVDVSKNFSDQIFDENYSTLTGKIGFNFYGKWNKEKIDYSRPSFYYFNLFYTYTEGNNISSFEQVDVRDYLIINDSTSTREVSKTNKAFRGNYQEFDQHTLSSELLFGLNDFLILDVFGDVQLSEKENPLYSYGGGLFFNVKSEDETKVNLGVFMKWIGSNEPFIGFKTELPIAL